VILVSIEKTIGELKKMLMLFLVLLMDIVIPDGNGQ
jgi:hypothetical protein